MSTPGIIQLHSDSLWRERAHARTDQSKRVHSIHFIIAKSWAKLVLIENSNRSRECLDRLVLYGKEPAEMRNALGKYDDTKPLAVNRNWFCRNRENNFSMCKKVCSCKYVYKKFMFSTVTLILGKRTTATQTIWFLIGVLCLVQTMHRRITSHLVGRNAPYCVVSAAPETTHHYNNIQRNSEKL